MIRANRVVGFACTLALTCGSSLVAKACDTVAAPASVVAVPQAVVSSSVFAPAVVAPLAVSTFAIGATPVVDATPQVQIQTVSCPIATAGVRVLAAPVVLRPRVIRPLRPVVVRSRVLVF